MMPPPGPVSPTLYATSLSAPADETNTATTPIKTHLKVRIWLLSFVINDITPTAE